MDELLAHYEVELRLLAADAAEFARRHPALAQHLGISGEGVSEDPHIERLMQSAALLNAHLGLHLDNGDARLTDALLQRMAPQYLRPFPACSIASFEPKASKTDASQALWLPRGTTLRSAPVHGVRCVFRTAYDVSMPPARVAGLRLRGRNEAPAGTPLPAGTTALLSLRLALVSDQAVWPSGTPRPLRLHLKGEVSQVAALREALCGQTLGTLTAPADGSPWRTAEGCLPRQVGFADDEALIDAHADAYRLLIEYFAFPAKFDFVDLPWPAALQHEARREVELHYALGGVIPGSEQALRLQGLDASNLPTGCTPVVNLFSTHVAPSPDGKAAARYTLQPDPHHAWAAEVYAIDRVRCGAEKLQPGEAQRDIPPLLSFSHPGTGPGWTLLHAGNSADGRPARIEITDAQGQPAPPSCSSLSVDLRATNADLPRELDIGNPGSDLELDGGNQACTVQLLLQPTPSRRFDRRSERVWPLISALSPNPLWLSGTGIEALRQLLDLHDLPGGKDGRRLAPSLQAIESRQGQAWMKKGLPVPMLAQGTELRLRVDEQGFTARGVHLFAQVLERFVPLIAHANSFMRLEVVSAHDQRVLYRGPVCPGAIPLLL